MASGSFLGKVQVEQDVSRQAYQDYVQVDTSSAFPSCPKCVTLSQKEMRSVKQDLPSINPQIRVLAVPEPLVVLYVPHDSTENKFLSDLLQHWHKSERPGLSFQSILQMGITLVISGQLGLLQLTRTAGKLLNIILKQGNKFTAFFMKPRFFQWTQLEIIAVIKFSFVTACQYREVECTAYKEMKILNICN